MFSTGTDDNTDTTDTAVDWADLTGSDVKVVNDKANFYGFSGAGNTPTNAVSREGATSISFSIDFNNGGGKIDTSKSAVRGADVPGPGGLNVNSVDVTFGITAGLPSSDYISAGSYANYPDVVDTDSGITYRPCSFTSRTPPPSSPWATLPSP